MPALSENVGSEANLIPTKNNSSLQSAKKSKNDEFYTQISDIEKELNYYDGHFKDKIVFCNCDNPEWSNFWKFFTLNFDYLGIKKVVSTHFEVNKPSYKLEFIGEKDANGGFVTINTPLEQNGDFRSPECIEILKEVDIVVTNPPFSLFREYIAQLVEYDKKFLVIGNYNSITYKEIFKLIKYNKLWCGISPRSMNFIDPDGKLLSVNASWFTNLSHKKRNEKFILYRQFNKADYPKYDNYDAIEVSKVKDIPMDYEGAMGVPITFMDKFNPDQFEIIGMAEDNGKGFSGGIWDGKNPHCVINGKNMFKRIFIKNKKSKLNRE